MNTIIRWSPFREIEQVHQRLAALWNRSSVRVTTRPDDSCAVAEWTPNVDIVEDDDEVVVKVELPEMTRDDVQVAVEHDALTVSGERRPKAEDRRQRYHRIECDSGRFTRSFTLPPGVRRDGAKAAFKNGMLLVHLPKRVPGRSL